MKNYRLLLISLLTAMLSMPFVRVYADDVELWLGYVDPTKGYNGEQKSPVLIPQMSIDNSTITFYTSCDGCTLRLINEDDDVEYATVIPDGTTSLVLPSYLSGDYEIQIIRGNFCFYGYISL